MSDDKSEIYKTGGGTFCPKTTTIDEKVVALLTPQFTPLLNEFDSSAPYFNLDCETPNNNETQVDVTKSDIVVIINDAKDVESEAPSTLVECDKRPHTSSTATTPKQKKSSLSEIKKSNINKLSASIIKRKKEKQINEDVLTNKKIEILEIQRQQEIMKLEKNSILLDVDIELKQVLLESAKLDLEFKKKKTFNL